MKRGGRRNGAGRPKHRTVLEVALSLSAPAEWTAEQPKYRDTGSYVHARYRPSKASVVRSSIPAAAIRIQEMEPGGRRGLASIEAELVDKLHAQTANSTTTDEWRRRREEDDYDGLTIIHPGNAVVPGHEVGSSIGDFLMERFYDGSMQPGEIRGLKRAE